MMRAALIAALIGTPALADDTADLLDYVAGMPAATAILNAATATCLTETDYGDMTADPYQAIVFTDLDGDGQKSANGDWDDLVIDFNFIGCAFGNVWSGTGGAPVHFIIDGDTAANWTGGTWRLVHFSPDDPVVILLGRHGSYCDGAGAQSCVQAITVGDQEFSTVIDAAPNASE